MATHLKTRLFQSSLLAALPIPDGTSLEELVNTFLLTMDAKDVLDVLIDSDSTGKYGMTTTHFASVVYR